MEKWQTWKIVLFIILCVCMNIAGKLFAGLLELPLWADSFGTVLCAYIAGPVCGAIVGVTGNLAYCVINHLSAAYSITSIALGIIIGIAARKNWFDRFYGFMKAASWAMLTSTVVSVPVNLIFDNGYMGNKWGNGVIEYLLNKEWPPFLCTVLGQLAIEFADKVLTVAAVYLIILIRHANKEEKKEKAKRKRVGGIATILICSLGLGLCRPQTAEAAVAQAETPDYNDYVQTVYSSNNGLPCGEANDIVQTNDGVLWIGTY
ncbi:MAG: hypothetical protein K6E16_09525, partial [Lachnospiraceae bacterium]|nr:hypothetical protein [Lachnospiraceae bacterium]